MQTYLLDTNIISYLADPISPFHRAVDGRIRTLPDDSALAISLLTLYELAYGYARDPGHPRLLNIIRDEEVLVVPPSEEGADVFGSLKNAYRLRTGVRERSLVRHNVDLILASTAIVEGAVLVSNDTIFMALAELEPLLKLENWAD